MTSILIVGGYGTVGRIISQKLAVAIPDRIHIAGRDFTKAKVVANAMPQSVTPVEFDITDQSSFDRILDDVTVVIVCLDQTDTAFVKACFERGIDYIDISASHEVLEAIESLAPIAQENEAVAVLSVGLAPGLTNLLAKDVVATLDRISAVDIYIHAGLGDRHGHGAIEWTLERVDKAFTVRENRAPRRVQGFSDPKTTVLPTYGRQRFYRLDFSDQHVLTRTLNTSPITTRISFDPQFIADTIYFLRRTGLFTLLHRSLGSNRLVTLFDRIELGTDEFIVKVEGSGVLDDRHHQAIRWIRGANQSRATGIVTAEIARRLSTSSFEPGVYHIEELFDATSIVDEVAEQGYTVGNANSTGLSSH